MCPIQAKYKQNQCFFYCHNDRYTYKQQTQKMIKRTNSFEIEAKEEQANGNNARIVASSNPNGNKQVTESKIIRRQIADSNDSIYESQQRADRVHDLDQGPLEPKSIKFTQQPAPHAVNYNSNKLTATANARMRGTKIPSPILQSIVKLASGKKPVGSMTSSKISRAIFEKVRQVKGNTFICDICAMEYKQQDRQKIAKCTHSFCDSCLRHYVDYKISRFEEVQCPSEDCPEIMDTDGAFYNSLTDQHKEKYKKVHAFSVVAKNPNSRLCPNQKCKDGILEIKDQKNPKCDKCGKVYCYKCFFPEHSGPCESNQIDFFQNNLHFRQCTNCKSVVEKTVGCNHIKCRCNYEFCYLCGGKWLNYEHRCGNNNQAGRPQAPAVAANNNDNCCDCDCLRGDNCCQTILRLIVKFLLLPLFLLGLVLALFGMIALLSLVVVMTIFMGIFPYTCEFICNLDCPWLLIAFIFYPISMMIGIGRSVADFFCEAAGGIIQMFCQLIENLAECLLLW